MKRQTLRTLYLVNIFMAFVILGELYYLSHKPTLPFETVATNGALHTADGSTIQSIQGYLVHSNAELEFVLDRLVAGNIVSIQLLRGSESVTTSVTLVHIYSLASVALRMICGLIYFVFGFLIIAKRPDETAGRVVNLAALAAAILVLDTWSFCGPLWLALAYRAISYFSYVMVPVLLLNFGLVFPRRLVPSSRRIMLPFIATAIAFSIVLTWLFANAATATGPTLQLEQFRTFDRVLTVARWLFGCVSIAAFAALIINYRNATEIADRKKLRWVLLGISFSALFFFFFVELPQLLGKSSAVNEYAILLSSLVAPISFAIAIIRYHILNIDTLINRATGYLAIGAVVFVLYVGVLLLATSVIGQVFPMQRLAASSIAAIVTAILFQPLRLRVQKFVDRTFFRVRYDFREAQKRILERLTVSRTAEETASILVGDLERLLQVEWAIVDVNEIARSSGEAPDVSIVVDTVRGNPRLVEQGAEFRPFEQEQDQAVALALPLKTERTAQIGTLMFGRKRSGERFRIEDVDLAISAAAQAALAIERSTLHDRVLEEQAEATRQKQLSELKSAFVRSVSHDLKTPLTSIKLFVQLLEQQFGATSPQALEYLKIIDGESDRLKLLIDNVLDHARIERGAMQYQFASADLNACAKQAVGSIEYLLKIQGFTYELDLSAEALPIEADETVLHTAIVNLLSNAMKYSNREKWIAVRTYQDMDERSIPVAVLECTDRGIGISKADLSKVFNPYFRSTSIAGGLQAAGTGLGLANVKHIVEAHGGAVTLVSISETVAAGVDQTTGTTVSIKLPLGR